MTAGPRCKCWNKLATSETPLLSQEGCLRAWRAGGVVPRPHSCKTSAAEPPRLAALGTPPDLGGCPSNPKNANVGVFRGIETPWRCSDRRLWAKCAKKNFRPFFLPVLLGQAPNLGGDLRSLPVHSYLHKAPLHHVRASRFTAGHTAKYQHPGQSVQGNSACAVTTGIKAVHHLARTIDDLTLRVDLKSSQRVVQYGRRPRRVKRGLLDLIHWGWLSEFGILSRIHERVVIAYRLFQH